MRKLLMYNGECILLPETEEERMRLEPEYALRQYFSGDERGMVRFAERLHELDRRFYLWQRKEMK